MLATSPGGLHIRPYYPLSSHFSLSARCKLSLSPTCPRFSTSQKSSKFRSLSLLLSRRKYSEQFSVRASATGPEVCEPVLSDAVPSFPQPVSVKIPFGDRQVSLKYGYFGLNILNFVLKLKIYLQFAFTEHLHYVYISNYNHSFLGSKFGLQDF